MAIIAVIGCGYVGHSLIKLFHKKFSIIAYDISKERIDYLRYNHCYINVIYTTDEETLLYCDIYIIAVPTNIYEDKQINLTHLLNVKNTLKKYIKPNNTIILESSINVGGTRSILSEFLDLNVLVGFSPERISFGDYDNLHTIPKIISGLTQCSIDAIYNIYSQVINKLVIVSSTETAEFCKLYENCFRVINIAYVNEIADLSKHYNIDFNEVIKASQTKPFGFMSFYPGFGVGGPCLPQNPYYLMHGLTNAEKELPILYNSINYLNQRPLIKASKFLKFNKILIIGIGFKPNSDSDIFSPTLKIYSELQKNNKDVNILDNLNCITIEYIKQFDCLIIGHQFNELDTPIINEYKINKFGEVFNF